MYPEDPHSGRNGTFWRYEKKTVKVFSLRTSREDKKDIKPDITDSGDTEVKQSFNVE